MHSPDPLPAGYSFLRQLQRGRNTDVYEVWSDERACRCVAKCLPLDRLQAPRPRRKLLREGRLLRRLAHLHLVRAYEVVVSPPAVILEVVTGATLARRLQDQGRLAIDEVVAIGAQICSVLHYLHRQPLLHLDLKPSNIVCERGLIKLVDLSIARRPGHRGPGIGTRLYMAPEQVRGGLVTPAVDVWSVGMVLFEAVTGQRPFTSTASQLPYPQLAGRAARVRSLRARVPPELRRIIDATLEPTPADRASLSDLSCTLVKLS